MGPRGVPIQPFGAPVTLPTPGVNSGHGAGYRTGHGASLNASPRNPDVSSPRELPGRSSGDDPRPGDQGGTPATRHGPGLRDLGRPDDRLGGRNRTRSARDGDRRGGSNGQGQRHRAGDRHPRQPSRRGTSQRQGGPPTRKPQRLLPKKSRPPVSKPEPGRAWRPVARTAVDRALQEQPADATQPAEQVLAPGPSVTSVEAQARGIRARRPRRRRTGDSPPEQTAEPEALQAGPHPHEAIVHEVNRVDLQTGQVIETPLLETVQVTRRGQASTHGADVDAGSVRLVSENGQVRAVSDVGPGAATGLEGTVSRETVPGRGAGSAPPVRGRAGPGGQASGTGSRRIGAGFPGHPGRGGPGRTGPGHRCKGGPAAGPTGSGRRAGPPEGRIRRPPPVRKAETAGRGHQGRPGASLRG